MVTAAALIAILPDQLGVARAGPPGQPDIVIILTDDQRFDSLWAMNAVRRRLQKPGVTFQNGIVSNPLCCPSRSTILTGRYAGGHGVWSNTGAIGGWSTFHDLGNERRTIATALDDAGYRTGLVGKYLNGYGSAGGAVPPGWDRWFALNDRNSLYYNYSVTDVTDGVGGTRSFGSFPTDYSTDVFAEEAVSFIEATPAQTPLFLFASLAAPHGPTTPAPQDIGAFDGQVWELPPSVNERDVRDKPRYIRSIPRRDAAGIAKIEKRMQRTAETLLAADRMVNDVVAALKRTGRLSNTMVVFMSDNGNLHLEHRWHYKIVPYEESIKVPFIVRYDPMVRGSELQGTVSEAIVSNVDLAPTLAGLAGATLEGPVDGVDFTRILRGGRPTRKEVLLESVEFSNAKHADVPSYCGLRSARRMYVRYATGEEEFYDLRKDPYQLENVADQQLPRMVRMRNRTRALCVPTPPQFAWQP